MSQVRPEAGGSWSLSGRRLSGDGGLTSHLSPLTCSLTSLSQLPSHRLNSISVIE